MSAFGDLRRHDRHRFRGQVEISWAALGGKTASLVGNCMDVSMFGMCVETPSQIAAGTQVTALVRSSNFTGKAVVRHCRPYGPWFRVGLAFREAVLANENGADEGPVSFAPSEPEG